MKIAHVCPFYYPAIGGIKQVVEELAKRQLAEGHDVHVFTSDWDKDKRIPLREEIIDGIKVHRCYHLLKIANFASLWPSVFSKILKGNFDIVHSHNFGQPHYVFSAFASKLSGAKHIHTTHCPWSNAKRSFLGKIGVVISYNIFSRLATKITSKIIAITPWEFNYIEKFGGQKEQIVNIPNGMSDIFFNKIKNNNFKKKHKIKGEIVLFLGRLNPVKSPDDFVKIAKMVLKEKKDTTFVILGPDEGMRKIVNDLIGNEKRIILLPETRDRNEVAKTYQAAEIYILPSYREGLPLTLFEAMACGLPIIATPVNGVPFEIKEPENGFLVNHGDNQKFKERILELLRNKSLRDKISLANIKHSQKYNWNIIFKKTMKVYEDTLKNKK